MSPGSAPAILTRGVSSRIDERVQLLSSDLDDGSWIGAGTPDPTVEPILWLVCSQADINFDPTLENGAEPGYIEVRFARWACGVNWSGSWNKKLPPWHFGVARVPTDGTMEQIVGILSPIYEMRTCWRCGVTGYHQTSFEHQLRTGRPQQRVPRCVPRQPCMGKPDQMVSGRVISWAACGALDWWGHLPAFGRVTRSQLQVDAAEAVARRTNEDALEQEFKEAPNAEGIMSPLAQSEYGSPSE